MPRKNSHQTWGRYHAQVERNIELLVGRRDGRIQEGRQWKIGRGAGVQDHVLMDDFDPKFLRHTMSLLHPQGRENFVTDPSLNVVNGEVTYRPSSRTV